LLIIKLFKTSLLMRRKYSIFGNGNFYVLYFMLQINKTRGILAKSLRYCQTFGIIGYILIMACNFEQYTINCLHWIIIQMCEYIIENFCIFVPVWTVNPPVNIRLATLGYFYILFIIFISGRLCFVKYFNIVVHFIT
jgi:hypothetical protein